MAIYLYAGAVAWVVGVLLAVISSRQLIKANPDRGLPHFYGRAHQNPVRSRVLRAGAFIFLYLSAFAFMEVWGYYAIVLMILGFLPGVIMIFPHNNRIQV